MPGKAFNKEIFASRLQELMKDNDDTIYSLGEYLHLSPSSISKYINANMIPKHVMIDAIADKYNVNPVWLMGADVDKFNPTDKKNKSKQIPVLGTIAAGKPIMAQEYIESYEHVGYDEKVDFCLRVKGDSMVNARIFDGDIVFIRSQPDVENGEIAAVIIDGEEATLKRVYKVNGSIILRPENPQYQDFVFSKKDMKSVRILGKAISFKSEVR
ncbi:repressor LexA [Anaerosolibacter carboniphilus]|uniref:Repressor LexA n=1 Tax=Anaerosolibacter carboniphilus TaxID=1417629 RepID=A0A841KXH0_9FIRM|nr:LexA family transcriptional regulator [Anaerosolibacter carboniphilus]MBB6215632.1 repressor LexA [Anaerosolibacter carboniphilus]